LLTCNVCYLFNESYYKVLKQSINFDLLYHKHLFLLLNGHL